VIIPAALTTGKPDWPAARAMTGLDCAIGPRLIAATRALSAAPTATQPAATAPRTATLPGHGRCPSLERACTATGPRSRRPAANDTSPGGPLTPGKPPTFKPSSPARRGPGLAHEESPDYLAPQADLGVLAEHGRRFFSIITRQAIRRGSCTSVRQLTDTIGAFIDHWNDHPRPFAWTKDADEILGKINRAKTKTNALTNH
jgi:hypothetical protein